MAMGSSANQVLEAHHATPAISPGTAKEVIVTASASEARVYKVTAIT